MAVFLRRRARTWQEGDYAKTVCRKGCGPKHKGRRAATKTRRDETEVQPGSWKKTSHIHWP